MHALQSSVFECIIRLAQLNISFVEFVAQDVSHCRKSSGVWRLAAFHSRVFTRARVRTEKLKSL